MTRIRRGNGMRASRRAQSVGRTETNYHFEDESSRHPDQTRTLPSHYRRRQKRNR